MIGQLVFVPASTSIYEGKKAVQQYQLAGLPVKLGIPVQGNAQQAPEQANA